MENRIRHLLSQDGLSLSQEFNPNMEAGMEHPPLPEGYDARRLPPPEPSRMLPLEVGFPKPDLLQLLDANLTALREDAPAIDATLGPEGEAETLFAMEALKAMRQWVEQNPAEVILIAMYPTSELEVVEEEDA